MGSLKLSGATSGHVEITAPDVAGTQTVEFPTDLVLKSEARGRNLLHNGAMQVHQRGVSASGLTTSSWHTADRWYLHVSSLGTWTATVESDAPTGSGFRKSLKLLCTTADASPAAGDYVMLRQRLEGQDVQALRKGTGDALPVTLSFWTKSNKPGTYVALLFDNNNARHVSAAYTVTSSGVWEYQSVTFPGDTSGAFTNDKEASLSVEFWMGAGSTYTGGTLGTTWGSTTANRAVGQANVGAVSGDYLQVTGIQLEAGSVASTFDHKSYATELGECQRYLQKSYGQGVYPGASTVDGICTAVTDAVSALTRHFVEARGLPVVMRDAPAVSVYSQDGTSGSISLYTDSASKLTVSSLTGTSDASLGVYITTSGTSVAHQHHFFHYVASAEI